MDATYMSAQNWFSLLDVCFKEANSSLPASTTKRVMFKIHLSGLVASIVVQILNLEIQV